MSIKLVAQAWEHHMTHAQRAVLQALADHGSENGGRIYPSYAYVSWKTDYSVRQVKRVVAGLIKIGVIIVTQRGNSHGKANLYHLNYDQLPKKAPFRGGDTMSPPSDMVTPGVVTNEAGGGGLGVTRVVATVSPQSPSESSLNQKRRPRANPAGSRAEESERKPQTPVYNPTFEERERQYEARRLALRQPPAQQKKVQR